MSRSLVGSPEHRLAMARLADKYMKISGKGARLSRRQIEAELGRERDSRRNRILEAHDLTETIRRGIKSRATKEDRLAAGHALVRLHIMAQERSAL